MRKRALPLETQPRFTSFIRKGIIFIWIFLFLLFIAPFSQATRLKKTDTDLFSLSFEEMLNLEIRSASKKDEEIRDVPASVTIITRRDIENMGYVTLEEIIINTPGFYHIDNYDDFLIGVRGTVGGSIAFLVNGVSQHPTRLKGLNQTERTRMNIPVEAIDRIDIIRGPMSVIYGNNAFFGTVNIITNEVEKNAKGAVSAAYGNENTGRFFARAAKAYDHGFFSLNAGGYQTDGISGRFSEVMSPDQLNSLHPDMHRKLNYLDREDEYFDFSIAYKKFNVDLRYSDMAYGAYGITPSFRDGIRYDLRDFYAALGYTDHLSDAVTLKAALIYSIAVQEIDFDFIFPTLTGYQDMNSERVEFEILLHYTPSQKISIICGYRHQLLYDVGTDFLVAAINEFGIADSDDVITNDLFFQVDYNITESLTAILGGRWSRINSYKLTASDDFNEPNRFTTVNAYDTETSFTPRMALVYSLSDHHVLKAMYGEATQHNNARALTELEEITTLELNYLATFPRWSFSFSGFKNTIENLKRRTLRLEPDTNLVALITESSGEWRTYGLEVILMAKPLDNFELEVSGVWQETEDKQAVLDEVGNSPAFLAKAKGVYHVNDLTLSLYAMYVDEMKADLQITADPNSTERLGDDVDAYVQVGANLRYRPGAGQWFFNLHGSNILDEEIRYPASEFVDFQRGTFGPQRRIIATIGYYY